MNVSFPEALKKSHSQPKVRRRKFPHNHFLAGSNLVTWNFFFLIINKVN